MKSAQYLRSAPVFRSKTKTDWGLYGPYDGVSGEKLSHVGKFLSIIILASMAAIAGYLTIKGIEKGNIQRCRQYQEATHKNPVLFFTLDYSTVQMCAKENINLIPTIK